MPHKPRQFPPHDLECPANQGITIKLRRARWWQFAADGAVSCTMSVGKFQPAVPQIVLAAAGITNVMLFPGHEVDFTFTGQAGTKVLVWSSDADDIGGEFTGGYD